MLKLSSWEMQRYVAMNGTKYGDLKLKKQSTFNVCVSGPEYEEVEVHLLREKTGFGFRILGGDEAVQAVSPDARDKARMGRAGPHTYLTSYTPTSSDLHLTSSHISSSYTLLTHTHTHTYTQAHLGFLTPS